jgi:inner membrane transporter RhtA
MVAILCVLVAIISIQSGASLAKQLFPIVGPAGTTTYRLVFSALILILIWRPWRHPITKAQLKLMSIYGLALGGMNLLFYLSIERIPLGIAVAIEFTGPLGLALILSRKLQDLVWVALAIAGILLVLPTASSSSQALDPMGIALALLAGICWALYIYFGQRAGTTLHAGRAAAIGMSVAALAIAPIGLVTSGSKLFDLSLIPIALGVGIFSSALPYSLEMSALKKLPAHTFSILMSLEPAAAALAGFLFLHEALTTKQLIAVGLVIIASTGSSMTSARRAKAKQAVLHA